MRDIYFYSIKSQFLFLLYMNDISITSVISVSSCENILKYFYISTIYKNNDIFVGFLNFYDYCYLIFLERLVEAGYVCF